MAREMAQWLGCLLCECEDPSSTLQHLHKCWVRLSSWHLRFEGVESDSQSTLARQTPDSVGPCLRKIKENKEMWDIGALLMLTSTQAPTGQLYMHAHMHAHTHMYKYICLRKETEATQSNGIRCELCPLGP